MYALFAHADPHSISALEDIIRTLEAAGAEDIDVMGVEHAWSIAAAFLGDREIALSASLRHLDNTVRHKATWAAAWAQWMVAIAQIRHGDSRRALTLLRDSLRTHREIDDRWGTVWGAHGVAWALATRLNTPSATNEASRRAVAEQIARVLGGAQRIREHVGAHVMGLRLFQIATDEAECAARLVLGDAPYAETVKEGSFPDLEITQAYPRIVAFALGQPITAAGPSVSQSGAEPHTDRLTSRENEIAALVAEGLSNPEIARKLVISVRTAQTHVTNILKKRGLRNRQQIAAWYKRSRRELATGQNGTY
jgi:DNA-binding CsgD family transcriptional regulator